MMLARALVAPTLAFALATMACGSDKPAPAGGVAAVLDGSVIERAADATLVWQIERDGGTKLAVHSASCQPAENVAGTLTFVRTSDGKQEDVKLTRDAPSGLYVANGPDLDPELTEVRYDLAVGGLPLRGTLYLPNDGTKALLPTVDAPKAPSDAGAAAAGPHGGSVEDLGDGKVEIVADADTGVVRVYPLTSSLAPADKPPQQIRLAVSGPTPGVVVLERVGEGAEAHFAAAIDPEAARATLTLVVKNAAGVIRVRPVGLRAGLALEVGPEAPVRRYWVSRGWVEELHVLHEKASHEGGKSHEPICHIPPGNPGNRHTITVGASAVSAHLAHGDHKGPCGTEETGGDVHAKSDGSSGKGDDQHGNSGDKGQSGDSHGSSGDKGQSGDSHGSSGDGDKGQSGDSHGSSGDKGSSGKSGDEHGSSGDKGKGKGH